MSEKELKPRTSDGERKKRKKKQLRKKGSQRFLIVLGTVVLIVATVLVTAKIAWPEVDLLFFLPQPAHSFVHESVLSNTTTTTTTEPPVTEPTTEPEPPKPEGHYAPIEDFAFDSDAKGNLVGNILQGGKTWHDNKYIYHIVDGDGIYRFATGSETYEKVYSSADYLSNLNIEGDYLYFTNDTDKKLYYLNKNGKELTPMAENIKTAYLYDGFIYYVTYSDILGKLDVSDSSSVTLYSTSNNTIDLIGISLKRVYFVSRDTAGKCRFLTVDSEGATAPILFREDAPEDEVKAPMMEDGFLYYYTKNEDGSYDLNRQKFGSENVVTLVEGTTVPNYAIVDMNSLFYAHREGETFLAKEYNMNTGDRVVRLKAEKVAEDNTLMVQHGGSYDFIIGWRSDKSWIYYASSMNTSSNLIMYFSDGAWAY